MHIKSLLISLIVLLPSLMWAKKSNNDDFLRPVDFSYYMKIGGTQLMDTYLSVVPYNGFGIGAGFENARVSRFGKHKWVTRHLVEIEYAQALNQRKNSLMLSFMLNYDFNFYRKYSLPCGVMLFAGGNFVVDAGTTYTGFGNNPAAAKASANIGFAGAMAYKLSIRNYSLTIRNNLSFPMIGAFYCPQYGASYYEMFYLENHKGMINFGWPGNNLYVSNTLSVDLPVKRRSVKIGYQCKFRSMHQNHLVYKNFTHEFILGVSVEKLIVNARGNNANLKNIMSVY